MCKLNRSVSVLCVALPLLCQAGVASAERAAAPPRTVVDYYLLLPASYFEIDPDSAKERLRLCHGGSAVIDIQNGYLRTWGDGAQMALTVCLFKRPDHTYLVAVNANRASDGDWEPHLDFYRYSHGRLVRAVPWPLPRRFNKQLGYRLPRHGTTVQVIDERGRTKFTLVWTRSRFRVRPVSSGQVVPPFSPAGVLPKSLHEERAYPSPDRKYVARLRHDEGDVWNLTLLDARSRRHLASTEDVQNLLWVPENGHRLVVATCGVYGEAMLVQWDGGSRWRSLHQVRHPDDECFMLYGVTRDGRAIIYGHDPSLNGSTTRKGNPMDRKRLLRLPP